MIDIFLLIIFIILNQQYFKISLNVIGIKKRYLLDSFVCFIVFESLLLLSFYALSLLTTGAIKIDFLILKIDYLKEFTYYWIIISFIEEICFRGILYNHFVNIWGEGKWIKAAIISSAIFGFIHIFANKPFLNAFIIGFIFCVIYRKCRNIFFIVILHAYSHGMVGFKPIILYESASKIPTPVKIGLYTIVLLFITSIIICTYILVNKYETYQNKKVQTL